MNNTVRAKLLVLTLLALVAVAAGAEELTVDSILRIHRSGAPADIIVGMVNSPHNTVAMTLGDLVTLRNAGVSETVITSIWAQLPAPTPAPTPLQPDDVRLVELVSLIWSGMSESLITNQVVQGGQTYTLSVNDLLYLKQNAVPESTIAALMATQPGSPQAPAVAPAEMVFDDLVFVKFGFWRKDREGRLVLRGDTFEWVDSKKQSENFTFQTTGLEKVWFTCDARSSGNFCYQINFKIVKGDRYRFRDVNRDSGSNEAVVKIMDALREYFPRLTFGTPSVDD